MKAPSSEVVDRNIEFLIGIDEEMGSRTREVYERSIELSPALLAVRIVPGRGTHFRKSPEGMHKSTVNLSDRYSFEYYSAAGLYDLRYEAIKSAMPVYFAELEPKNTISFSLAHELGHAVDHAFYIELCDGNTEDAYNLALEIRLSELASLPLGKASSLALEQWREPWSPLKEQLQSQGVTEATFQELLIENTRAYAALPSEASADSYALGVLAAVYS